jgi:hypothetical protein
MTREFFIKNLWRWKCGMMEDSPPTVVGSYEEIYNETWSKEFERLMHVQIILGSFRYGRWTERRAKNIKYDYVAFIKRRLDMYQETGNTEYLVDAANGAMLAFEFDYHPTKHFHTVDDGEHDKRIL